MKVSFRVPMRTFLATLSLVTATGLAGIASAQDMAVVQENVDKVSSAGGRAQLDRQLAATGKVRVIVTLSLNRRFRPGGHLPPELAATQRADISGRQSDLLQSVGGNGVEHVRRFQEVPQMALTVNAAALDKLAASPLVESIAEDAISRRMLDLSVPRIGSPTLGAQNLKGTGKAVAVLDTGVDKNHSMLLGSVVSEACYSNAGTVGVLAGSGYTSQTACPGGFVVSTAANSAMPYGGTCPAGECDHGTHVAGIAAGRNNGLFSGVAPAANVIAIQVFTVFNDTGAGYCGGFGFSCVLSYTSDQMAGLERVAALRNTFSIASVNMSLGGGSNTTNCDSDPRKPIIDTLRSHGIATVISSGNNGFTNSMGAPGCISSAISVGATTDAETVASYSNSVSFLNLLAPGSSINSAIPGNLYDSWNGTSMAAPHVAGAFALLKQARPNASVTEMLTALASTGVPITDSKNGLTKPRIQVNTAASSLPFSSGGRATLGLFLNGLWYLDANGNKVWNGNPTDMLNSFGIAGDVGVVGDWNGNGKTKIGVFRAGKWYLDYNGNGVWDGPVIDRLYSFGIAGDVPVVGVWTAGGPSKVGVFRAGKWYLDHNGNGAWDGTVVDRLFSFGIAGDVPVTGDWSGNGVSKIGVFRSGAWYLDQNGNGAWNGTGGLTADVRYSFGIAGDVPVVGDWNGNGADNIGVYRAGSWYLDYSGTGAWEGRIADQFVGFGVSVHKPLVGKLWR